MSHKTKAAMQGRQCHYQKLKQSQDTRVNAGGQSLSAPVIAGTAPLARLRETTQKLGCLRCTALPHTQSPETSGELEQSAGCTAMQHTPERSRSFDKYPDIGCYGLHKIALAVLFPVPGSSLAHLQWRIFNHVVTSLSHSFWGLEGSFPSKYVKWQVLNVVPNHPNYLPNSRYSRKPYRIIAVHVLGKGLGQIVFLIHRLHMCNKNALSHLCASSSSSNQPFGSIPCRRNSARANSFIQLPRLTPSRSAASFSCWRRSGLILIWKVGDQPSPLGVLSRLIVDTYVHNLIACILLCTYVITSGIEKTTPQTVGAVLGRLTKPLVEVTVMAELQHTQTRPEFTWRFISASERYPTAKPLVIYVNASSEQEARDTMPGVNLIFAARLPFHAFQAMEVRHA